MKIIERIKARFNMRSRKDKAIANALKCKGWTSDKKLALLYDLAQQTNELNGDILEIGSAWGRSTVLLALSSNKKIWSIDPHTGGIAFIRKGENQDSYDEFQVNLKKNNVNGKVEIIKYGTFEASINNAIPQDVLFSLVFIDGLHTAEGVKIDFDYAFNRLVENGVMVFDDYFEITVSDYAEMIDKLAELYSLELIRDDNSRLAYCYKKTENAQLKLNDYQMLLGNVSQKYKMLELGFHGDDYLINLVNKVIGNCTYFIETGTNVGSTLGYVAREHLTIKCLSCEPDKKAYAHAVVNVSQENVTIYNENSQDFLVRLEKNYQRIFGENVMFWLDAHGYGFEWPLKQEISFITNKFKSAYIFIDDFKIPDCNWFGYDSYDQQECSFEYIKDSLNPRLRYDICYPNYVDKTSFFHPLRGWCLIYFGPNKLEIPAELANILTCTKYYSEAS